MKYQKAYLGVKFTVILSVIIFFFIGSSKLYSEEVSGAVSGKWTLAASPYIVTSDIFILEGEVLSIEPGVVIKFAGYHAFTVNGLLRAIGNLRNPIIMTTVQDQGYGNLFDSGNAALGQDNGSWVGVFFFQSSSPESVMSNCLIRYGSQPLVVSQAYPRLERITISNTSSNTVTINNVAMLIQDGAADYLLPEQNIVANGGLATVESEPSLSAGDEFSFGEISLSSYSMNDINIFGYFSTRFEKVFAVPSLENGATVKRNELFEFSHPFFNLFLEHQLSDAFRVFMNLNGSGAGEVDLRNFWGEYSPSNAFNIRLGKIYRKFGLYNEILDAVPTYFGIEPPELFDGDHLLITRTTTLMLHGAMNTDNGTLNYSFTTDNGEGSRLKDAVPIGWDLNYEPGSGGFTAGFSGYWSGGKVASNKSTGEGPPDSGVLPWMASDKFRVFGGYIESRPGNLILQFEYWKASHEAERDPEQTVAMIKGANPNDNQLERYLIDPQAPTGPGNINTNGNYDIKTWYVRAGYNVDIPHGELAPYLQWDWYSNPEVIKSKEFGGDNEAGFADDGKFNKATLGLVYRPVPQVAVKLDGSAHIQKFEGKTETYPEVRVDISFIFGQIF